MTSATDNLAHALATALRIDVRAVREALREYQRGGLPTQSMPEYTSGGGGNESPMLKLDREDLNFAEQWRLFELHVRAAAQSLDSALLIQGYFVNKAKALEDPKPRKCTNCDHVHTMVGRDVPQDASGRCNACRMYHKRTKTERPT